jgi:hypothetical protein
MLPSGRVVGLVGLPEDAPVREASPKPGPPYAEAIALLEMGGVIVRSEGRPVDARSLLLTDFHALRAVLTRLGWLGETPVTIACRNCKARIEHLPCAAMELGPFIDRELHHPELDALLDLGVPHPIPAVRVAKKAAHEITLAPITLGEAAPLHDALTRRRLAIVEDVVRAMGVVALGEERSPLRIARALARAPEASFLAISAMFLAAHYSPRLFSIARCPACGARNDVNAPFDREFSPDKDARGPLPGARAPHPYRGLGREPARAEPAPTFESFDALSRELFAREEPDEVVALVVEGEVPACDEGGEPLLGSYTPPFEGDASSPSRSAEVTVFYRTFVAIWEEDGPYDWEEELRETIEHELAHHAGYQRGRDEVDLEERRVIDEEAIGIIGARGTARLLTTALARDLAGFMKRTWPLWLLVAIGTAVTIVMGR